MKQIEFVTPMGWVRVQEEENKIIGICFFEKREEQEIRWEESGLLIEAQGQILEFLYGKRREIQLPYTLNLPPFSKQVLESLPSIPYGTFSTYGEWAKYLQKPGAARAVGNALHRNPLLLLLPCHRILGTGGKLGGYAAGEEMKKKLLLLEGISWR